MEARAKTGQLPSADQPERLLDIRLVVDTIPTLAWSARPDGSADFFNQRWLEYTGFTLEQALDWGWKTAIHPDDLPRMLEVSHEAINLAQAFEVEGRFRRFDGEYRWFLVRGSPLCDQSGKVVKWYGTNTDLEDNKRAVQSLREAMAGRMRLDAVRAEVGMALAQKDTLHRMLHTCAEALVHHLDAAFARIWTLSGDGLQLELQASAGMYTRLDGRYSRISIGRFKVGLIAQERKAQLTNDVPNDPRIDNREWARNEGMISFAGYPLIVEDRLVGVMAMFSKKVLTQNTLDTLAFIADGIAQGIERKRVEDALRASEHNLRLMINSLPGLIATVNPAGEIEFVNQPISDFFGKTAEELKDWAPLNHPDDREHVVAMWRRSIETGVPYETVHRLLGVRGYRWFNVRGLPLRDEKGRISRWYFLLTDVENQKQAEEALRADIEARKQVEQKLRENEAHLLEMQALTRTGSFRINPRSGRFTVTPEVLRRYDIKIDPDEDMYNIEFWFDRIHPEDRKMVRDLLERSAALKIDYEAEYRIVLPDGAIKHNHSIGHPVLNEAGDLVEIVGTTMEVTEQVQAREKLERAFAEIQALKDQLQKENVALREEVDRVAMFEEIVGSSPALRAVLSRVAKVAPTDSTVLITGETGTGKELIARAIHKRSPRAQRAFVSVNCAALAPSLIASELFGHEKGAFTGAVQRRIGRFELADGGTMFLDEVGELPLDTQVALLRALQEREFERVGGKDRIQVEVRIIAATNRNLEAAIAAGTFRSDLFYRLNVFPIEIPPLRQRMEDVLMLLEYFVHRYARAAGKSFTKIDKQTLKQFQAYDWPGNIRELQNVVERSVIVSSDDTFCVDEAWLSRASNRTRWEATPEAATEHSSDERQIIEAALAECRGRVSGPKGAAARLGVPPSTLDSRIKKLKISKQRFKLG
jgi:PAS domain S-box-containing protein